MLKFLHACFREDYICLGASFAVAFELWVNCRWWCVFNKSFKSFSAVNDLFSHVLSFSKSVLVVQLLYEVVISPISAGTSLTCYAGEYEVNYD